MNNPCPDQLDDLFSLNAASSASGGLLLGFMALDEPFPSPPPPYSPVPAEKITNPAKGERSKKVSKRKQPTARQWAFKPYVDPRQKHIDPLPPVTVTEEELVKLMRHAHEVLVLEPKNGSTDPCVKQS